MKKIIFCLSSVICLSLFSLNVIAQEDSGGFSNGEGGTNPDGSTTTVVAAQPLAFHFTRNNGDGSCGDKAQIRMYYTTAPTVAPVLNQIYYQGEPLFANFQPVTANIADFATKGYASFCLSVANIPPAIKLTLTYTPGGTNQPAATITGTD